MSRPRQDSNLQSSDPKSDALSIRPRGLHIETFFILLLNTIIDTLTIIKINFY